MSEHPLTHLMETLAERSFQKVGLTEPALPRYAAQILVDFTRVDTLYKVQDSEGRRIEDVGEMLLESDIRYRARSLERERSVRKHIGDFTLFFTGMFPEHIKARRNWWRLDRWLDWIETGKESYRIVGEFNMSPYTDEAPLFRRLADHFDFMVVGLNYVREELDRMQESRYLIAKDIIGE